MDVVNKSPFLQKLKKKMYLYILPFVISAFTLGWIFDGMHDKHDFVNHTIFPLLNVWFVIVLILIIFNDKLLRLLEITSFVLVTLLFLSWFTDLVFFQADMTFTNGGLGEFTNWIPLFFIYIFLIFDRKKALIMSIVIFLLSVLIGFSSFPGSDGQYKIRAMDTFLQFYFSTATYILALYFLQHLKEAYIQNETTKQIANTDYLTGLPNRRMLEEKIEGNSKSTNHNFSVIFFDVDLFKMINDNYGHDTGDLVLREFTDLIRQNTRETEMFGRWGGEEFLIIANQQDLRQSFLLADRLRNIVANHSFFKVGPVTASFGVAESKPFDNPEALVKRADIALYRAKEQGRNQVHAYE
jgi:diguanylate cyclase (GGDEF)-like protein